AGGQIVGLYLDPGFTPHGFLLSGGSYSTLDVPGADFTVALGIDTAGQIVGSYLDAGLTSHGFLLNRGSYSTLDVPGSTGTSAAGLNAAGQIVGSYLDADSLGHGFLATPAQAVPEPSTLTLLAVGTLGLLGYRRRSRKEAA